MRRSRLPAPAAQDCAVSDPLHSSEYWVDFPQQPRTSLPGSGACQNHTCQCKGQFPRPPLPHLLTILDWETGRFVEPLIDVRRALAAPVARAMHLFRPHGIPMTHHLRDRLHSGALLVVDVDATMWHSGLSWCAAWTAGGMVERPPPPAGAQPLPGFSPLPRDGARVMHPAHQDPQRS